MSMIAIETVDPTQCLPVRDVHVVEVLDGHDDVFHEFGRLALRELLLLLDALEELAAAHALHHDLQAPLAVLKGVPLSSVFSG